MKITDGEFDAFIEDLAGTLDEFKVPETEQKGVAWPAPAAAR